MSSDEDLDGDDGAWAPGVDEHDDFFDDSDDDEEAWDAGDAGASARGTEVSEGPKEDRESGPRPCLWSTDGPRVC